MSKFVAMLRGVNVGGHHRVPMAELRALCTGLGWRDVQTYIQSGNVVFSADGEERSLTAALTTAASARFGFDVPVVVRSAADLALTLAQNPFDPGAFSPTTLSVVFLAAPPPAAALAALDPARSSADTLVPRGRDLYLLTPAGFAKTKYTLDWLERRLGGPATARNWQTVTVLAEMSRAGG